MSLPKPYYQDDYVTIYHGDCREILPELPDSSVDIALTSPPYNVGMEYEVVLDWEVYYAFTREWLSGAMLTLKDGGILAINLPKEIKHTKEQIEKYGRRVEKISAKVDLMCGDLGFLPRESIVWGKGSEGQPISNNFKMGSDNNIYIRSVCELILLHSKGRYYYDGGTGMRGRSVVPFLDETKDIWWLNPSKDNAHPCPFPSEIPIRLMRMFTLNRKFVPIVLDPFLGSGTTAYCAKKLNRKCVGIEIEEKYCEIAANRCRQMVFDLSAILPLTKPHQPPIQGFTPLIGRLPLPGRVLAFLTKPPRIIPIHPSPTPRAGLDLFPIPPQSHTNTKTDSSLL